MTVVFYPYFSYQVVRRPMCGPLGWVRLAWHYGVRVWDPQNPARFDQIIELQKDPAQNVRWVTHAMFEKCGKMRPASEVIRGGGADSAASMEAGMRCESFFELGRGVINRVDFRFLERNCEHFATWIATGVWGSAQVEKWFRWRVRTYTPNTDPNHPFLLPPV